MRQVDIYTDGACSGNPGVGGWGVVLIYGEHEKELSGSSLDTTNNRMELTAAIKGLEALKERCKVNLYSDSKYLVDAMNKGWIQKWQKNDWMRTNKDKVKNIDLWKRILQLINFHEVSWIWVRGHSLNKYNNRCDKLATDAIKLLKRDV